MSNISRQQVRRQRVQQDAMGLLLLLLAVTAASAYPVLPHRAALSDYERTDHFANIGEVHLVAELSAVAYDIDIRNAQDLCATNWKGFLEGLAKRNDGSGMYKSHAMAAAIDSLQDKLHSACMKVTSWNRKELQLTKSKVKDHEDLVEQRRQFLSRNKRFIEEFALVALGGLIVHYIEPFFRQSHTSEYVAHKVLNHTAQLADLSVAVSGTLKRLDEDAYSSSYYVYNTASFSAASQAISFFSNEVDAVERAIGDAKTGRLNYGVLTIQQSLSVHKKLLKLAAEKDLMLGYSNPMDLLNMHNTVKPGDLGLQVVIHVPMLRDIYTLHEYIPTPVFVDDHTHAPRMFKVAVEKPFLATKGEFEIPMDLQDLARCHSRGSVYDCKIHQEYPASSSCIGAIFNGNITATENLCKFHRMDETCHIAPGVKEDSFILTTTKEYDARRECGRAEDNDEYLGQHLIFRPQQREVLLKKGCTLTGDCFRYTASNNGSDTLRVKKVAKWNVGMAIMSNRSLAEMAADEALLEEEHGSLDSDIEVVRRKAEAARADISRTQKMLSHVYGGFGGGAVLIVVVVLAVLAVWYKLSHTAGNVLDMTEQHGRAGLQFSRAITNLINDVRRLNARGEAEQQQQQQPVQVIVNSDNDKFPPVYRG